MKSSLPTGLAGMTKTSHGGMIIKHLPAGRQVRDSLSADRQAYDLSKTIINR